MNTVVELLILLLGLLVVATPFVLVARLRRSWRYRLAIGIALFTALFVTWVNLAVGIVGGPEHPANLPYFAIIALAFLPALAVRRDSRKLAMIFFLAALAQAALAAATWFTDPGAPVTPRVSLLLFNGMLLAGWLAAATLFHTDREMPA